MRVNGADRSGLEQDQKRPRSEWHRGAKDCMEGEYCTTVTSRTRERERQRKKKELARVVCVGVDASVKAHVTPDAGATSERASESTRPLYESTPSPRDTIIVSWNTLLAGLPCPRPGLLAAAACRARGY